MEDGTLRRYFEFGLDLRVLVHSQVATAQTYIRVFGVLGGLRRKGSSDTAIFKNALFPPIFGLTRYTFT